MRKRLDVRLPEEMDAALRRRADELDRSITWVVERALEATLASGPTDMERYNQRCQETERALEAKPPGGEPPAVATGGDGSSEQAVASPASPRASEATGMVDIATRLALARSGRQAHLPTCKCPICKPPKEKP